MVSNDWVHATGVVIIRCKFRCDSIHEFPKHYQYHMSPVYGDEANRVYWEATPTGSFQVTIMKEKGKLFNVGQEYYLDVI